ncbi:L-rhamnose/proton symporter RhaT [Saccharicrinis fermentans]|uniref:L-rhamnose-H(+) transport protein n=1 Tax=Saccharicrinis fermentans DSM 9555 = JCM 21142 TaxID=869213 RepID=W7Y3L2_9BACT|nr:L-rhamnose/proton symporter RhaT [Saccharicrinis fermentans]GAF05460.1 L-rhamnose-H(+) transport protein [Saccharicrinis fermentans DSM 9555 = JCM 21142]
MEANLSAGLPLVILAGICAGTFAIPFKFNNKWTWENNWLIWSIVALLIAPWVMAIVSVPDLIGVYKAEPENLLLISIFGIIWGIGAIMFGKGIDLLGVSLSFPIMLGLINSVGTIMPIVLRDPDELFTPDGLKIITGVVIILIGIVIVSVAGSKKNNVEGSNLEGKSKKNFVTGIIVCLLAGIFGPMINFAFVYGEPIQAKAVEFGASVLNSANPVWSIALTGGFIANAFYCIFLFRKNNSLRLYDTNFKKFLPLAALAGVIWYFSIMFYGMGSNSLGKMGASVGWATMQTLSILVGNMAGIITGEWKGTQKNTMMLMYGGVSLLIIGLVIIAL